MNTWEVLGVFVLGLISGWLATAVRAEREREKRAVTGDGYRVIYRPQFTRGGSVGIGAMIGGWGVVRFAFRLPSPGTGRLIGMGILISGVCVLLITLAKSLRPVRLRIDLNGGRPLTEVFVNGTAYAFVVDTGCSTTIVSLELAEELDLARGPLEDVKTFLSPTEMVPLSRVQSVAVGSTVVDTFPVLVNDLEPLGLRGVDGILGMDYLRHFCPMEIDYYNQKLTLQALPRLVRRERQRSVSAHVRQLGGRLTVLPVVVNGMGPYAFLVDTGSDVTIVSADVARAACIPLGEVAPMRCVSGVVMGRAGTVDVLGFGPALVHDLAVVVHSMDEDSPFDGMLGCDYLGEFTLRLSLRGRKLTLTTLD